MRCTGCNSTCFFYLCVCVGGDVSAYLGTVHLFTLCEEELTQAGLHTDGDLWVQGWPAMSCLHIGTSIPPDLTAASQMGLNWWYGDLVLLWKQRGLKAQWRLKWGHTDNSDGHGVVGISYQGKLLAPRRKIKRSASDNVKCNMSPRSTRDTQQVVGGSLFHRFTQYRQK